MHEIVCGEDQRRGVAMHAELLLTARSAPFLLADLLHFLPQWCDVDVRAQQKEVAASIQQLSEPDVVGIERWQRYDIANLILGLEGIVIGVDHVALAFGDQLTKRRVVVMRVVTVA